MDNINMHIKKINNFTDEEFEKEIEYIKMILIVIVSSIWNNAWVTNTLTRNTNDQIQLHLLTLNDEMGEQMRKRPTSI
jgi:lipid II:glycine glycyltransferase (peptidoglycan interpeptide bridge formation enzyme)